MEVSDSAEPLCCRDETSLSLPVVASKDGEKWLTTLRR